MKFSRRRIVPVGGKPIFKTSTLWLGHTPILLKDYERPTIKATCIGLGTLVDISSKGVAFRAEAGFLAGMKVRAFIGWPTVPGAECALQLCVDGRVVRVEGSLVAARIDRYDFRACLQN